MSANTVENTMAEVLRGQDAQCPQCADVVIAAEVLALPPRTLLHAGPRFAHAARPPEGVLASAVLCCLHEGWASTETQAQQLIKGGHVRLRPGEAFGVVIPETAVVSPRTALVEVRDATTRHRRWAPIASSPGAAVRCAASGAAEAAAPAASQAPPVSVEIGQREPVMPQPLPAKSTGSVLGQQETPAYAPTINDPEVMETLETAFDAYERALTSNDVAALDRFFWTSPHVLRYGATEHLYGEAEIRAFRAARPSRGLQRTVIERSVTTFGDSFAVTNIVFTRVGEARLGRQTQSWVRLDGCWQVVAAHVSWMDL